MQYAAGNELVPTSGVEKAMENKKEAGGKERKMEGTTREGEKKKQFGQ